MSVNSIKPGRSVVSKFAAILMTFRQGGSHSLSEIASLSGLPISTTHRMVNDLADWLVLEKDRDDRTYRLGQALKGLSESSCCSSRNVRNQAAPWLEDLSRAVDTEVRLGVLEYGTLTYIEKRRGHAVSQFSTAATLPLHATAAGKILMAFTPEHELRPFVNRRMTAYTSRTIVDPDQLRWALRKARINGYAVADRELRPDGAAIAAPIFGAGGRIAAALEVEVGDLSTASETIRPALLVAASGLSREFKRPCGHCRSGSAGAEGGGDGLPDSASVEWQGRPRCTAGSAINEVRSVRRLGRQPSADRSPTARQG
jgi:DNA-binding IclR family transcriptional regulator